MTDNITGKLIVPAHITFYSCDDKTEIMRLTREGVFVNHDIKPDDAANAVLDALNSQVKVLVQRAVEDEREECAKLCDELAAQDKLSNYYAVAARAIRARGEK